MDPFNIKTGNLVQTSSFKNADTISRIQTKLFKMTYFRIGL